MVNGTAPHGTTTMITTLRNGTVLPLAGTLQPTGMTTTTNTTPQPVSMVDGTTRPASMTTTMIGTHQ